VQYRAVPPKIKRALKGANMFSLAIDCGYTTIFTLVFYP
jgi:hypothetical protein